MYVCRGQVTKSLEITIEKNNLTQRKLDAKTLKKTRLSERPDLSATGFLTSVYCRSLAAPPSD